MYEFFFVRLLLLDFVNCCKS